jgi:hypothetical protein
MYSVLVSILLQTFRARVVTSALRAEVTESALRSAAVARPTVPLAANFVRTLAGPAGLFLFAGTCLVSCAVILEVTGFEMSESGHIGEFDMLDLSNVPSDGLVQVNDLSL